MSRRCSLCGGKLNGNICTECGLDNSKNDSQYITLGKKCEEEPMTHVHTENEKPYEGKTVTRENAREARKAKESQTYSYAQVQVPANNKKKASKKAAKRSIIPWNILIIIGVILIIGSITKDTLEEESFWEDNADTEYSSKDQDPYKYVVDVMPEEGAAYETELTAGIYKGGVHIPEGTYSVSYLGGNGYVEQIDSKNTIWECYYFGDAYESSLDGVDDFRVYPGTYVVVYDAVILQLKAENAQNAFTKMENQEEGVWNLSRSFTVGEEIPAGVYDVTCTNGGGSSFSYTAVDSEGYETNLGMPFGNNEGDYVKELKNIVLTDGTEVDMDEIEAQFVPSKEIESEDYNSFYNNFY